MLHLLITCSVWSFVIAAVIDGLGIVRLPGGFAAFQLFLHVLLWRSIFSVGEAGPICCLTCIYPLTGPAPLSWSASFVGCCRWP